MNEINNIYYWNEKKNFGDQMSLDVSEYAWKRKFKLVDKLAEKKLIAIGSILQCAARGDVVWGAGIHPTVYESFLKKSIFRTGFSIQKNIIVKAVRGPLTREFLQRNKINCPEIYGDPAIFAPLVYNMKNQEKLYIGIISHFKENQKNKNAENIFYIDPARDWRDVADDIFKCRAIVSSSLHGIILAESYGIPAIFFRPKIEGVIKYLDYYGASGRFPVIFTDIEEAIFNAKIACFDDGISNAIKKQRLDLINSLEF